MKYTTFAQMIVVGTLIMFGLMYLNTYSADHIFFSETRAFIALVMGATMAVVMLAFMWKMYPNKGANVGILVGSLHRYPDERAREDYRPEVRKLADGIIAAQKKEIGGMKDYIRDLEAQH